MLLEFDGRRIALAAGELVIGSDPAAGLRLSGPSVRARHAVVRRAEGARPLIVPGEPDAGIEVNGTRIGPEPTPLMHGDRIRIGEHELRVSDPLRRGDTRVLSSLSDAEAGHGLGRAEPATRRSGPVGRLVRLTDGREYGLGTAPFVLGRDASAEVVIGSPDASRRHAEIASRADGDVLEDLSANGTFVNGARVNGPYRLKALDVIRIGAEEFRYYPPPPLRPRSAEPPPGAEFRLNDTLIGFASVPGMPAAERPRARGGARPLAGLLVRRGAGRGDRLSVFSPTASIGRADSNDLRLADPSVAATHAKLELREGVWTLSDLGSAGGTRVDGIEVVDEAPLSPGTVITLGEVDLLFEPQDEGVRRGSATRASLPADPAPAPATAPATTVVGIGPDQPSRRTSSAVLVGGAVVLVAALAALAFLL